MWVHGAVEGTSEEFARVSNVEYMALVRQCGRDFWLAILKGVPWGVRRVVFGWYLLLCLMSSV